MIHYQLRCAGDHAFDGWFQDSAGFDRLAASGMVECPTCGGTRVSRALMAPAIGRGHDVAPQSPPPVVPPVASPPAVGAVPAELMAVLQRVRARVEKECDYVGPGFAAEARRMHDGESEHRGIYGEASEAEAQALHEDGVAVVRIPWVPRADG